MFIQARGAMIFLTGVLSLLVFDHDEKLSQFGDQDGSGKNVLAVTRIT